MKAELIYLLSGLAAGIILGMSIAFLLVKSRYTADIARLTLEKEKLLESIDLLNEEKAALQERLEALNERYQTSEKEHIEQLAAKEAQISRLEQARQLLQEQWDADRKRWEEERQKVKAEMEEREKYLLEKTENLTRKILEDTSQKFTEHNRQKLEEIIQPFKADLQAFKQQVEQVDKAHLERTVSLKQQIKSLEELNRQITREAQNLTKALKGDTKTQGTWGEIILERVLEKSGLEKGREYVTQSSFEVKDNEGRQRLRPDVIVYLPDKKAVIIDAKVSLKAFEAYMNTEDEAEREHWLKMHVQSIRNHIRELSAKEYWRLEALQGYTPDFVLMFIPVEPAFAAALRMAPELYDEALRKNVVLTTPTTLLAVLKMIESMWKNEYQQRNVGEILRQATALYEKFKGFSDDLIVLGNKLEDAKKAYNQSMNKLSEGKDNLVRKVERLRKLGLKPKKEIDPRLLRRALDEGENDEA